MSEVWGTLECKLEKDGATVTLDHATISPNFFQPAEIMHQSIITEKRTWSNDLHFSEFSITDHLYEYADPNAKADELLALENQIYLFTPFSMLWSKYVIVTLVEVKPIRQFSDKEIAVIGMVSIDPGTLGDYMKDKAGNRYKTKAGQYIRRRIKGI